MNLFFDTVYFTVSPPLTTFQFRSAMSQKTQIHKLKNAHCQIKSELLQKIIPSPSDNFEIGKIGLPHFIDKTSFGVKLICRA